MHSHPTRHRLKFSDVALGQRFYDPISAEYFMKLSDSMAAMVTGIGDGTVPDEFEPDDVVGIDQERRSIPFLTTSRQIQDTRRQLSLGLKQNQRP